MFFIKIIFIVCSSFFYVFGSSSFDPDQKSLLKKRDHTELSNRDETVQQSGGSASDVVLESLGKNEPAFGAVLESLRKNKSVSDVVLGSFGKNESAFSVVIESFRKNKFDSNVGLGSLGKKRAKCSDLTALNKQSDLDSNASTKSMFISDQELMENKGENSFINASGMFGSLSVEMSLSFFSDLKVGGCSLDRGKI